MTKAECAGCDKIIDLESEDVVLRVITRPDGSKQHDHFCGLDCELFKPRARFVA